MMSSITKISNLVFVFEFFQNWFIAGKVFLHSASGRERERE